MDNLIHQARLHGVNGYFRVVRHLYRLVVIITVACLEQLGIGEAEVVSVSAPSHYPTVEATLAQALQVTKATVTSDGRVQVV